MKTIFVSLFEGVEAKNLLRTGVVGLLLAKPDIRVVLLMRSEERALYYQKEFRNERLIYQVVPYERTLGKGFDRLFAHLKFLFLRTETTRLRRRLAYETGGNWLFYFLNTLANFILARRPVRRLARLLDFLLVRNQIYTSVFDRYQPDLVFLAHLFEEPEIHILREAKRRKIKTVGLLNSWDKVTARCMIRLLPDRMCVFNQVVKQEIIEHNDFPDSKIIITGLPQYDVYFATKPISRIDFLRSIKVPEDHKLLVYAPFGRSFSSADWDTIDLLYELNKKGEFGPKVTVFVRFQPNDFLDEDRLKARPWLQYEYPGTRFGSERGVDWELSTSELLHLRDTLAHLDVLVAWGGSMPIDAAVFDKPIVNPFFLFKPPPTPVQSPLPHYRFTHYANVINTGAVSLAENHEELAKLIRGYLLDSSIKRVERKRLVSEQCAFTDGKSAERIASAILETLYAKN